MKIRGIIIVLTTLLIVQQNLFAHKMKIFAANEGKLIKGYVYFSGGGRAQGLKVNVYDGRGEKIAELKTDSKGIFCFAPKAEDNYRFEACSGDGHRTAFKMENFSAPEKTKTDNAEKTATRNDKGFPDRKEFAALIGEEISRQLLPLKIQLAQYEDKMRFRDILGGIGYIIGIAGIYMYFLSLKKK